MVGGGVLRGLIRAIFNLLGEPVFWWTLGFILRSGTLQINYIGEDLGWLARVKASGHFKLAELAIRQVAQAPLLVLEWSL